MAAMEYCPLLHWSKVLPCVRSLDGAFSVVVNNRLFNKYHEAPVAQTLDRVSRMDHHQTDKC